MKIRFTSYCAAVLLPFVALKADASAAVRNARQIVEETRLLQDRIDAAWRDGGGEVVVGAGVYRLNPVRLRSGVRLRLSPGAHLYGNDDCEAYVSALAHDEVEPVTLHELRTCSGEDLTERSQYALFYGFRAHDVEIVGEPGSFVNGVNCPDPKGAEGYRGPHAFWFACSTNVSFRGVRVAEAGDYAYRFVACRSIRLRNVSAEGGHDGVHFDLCSDVRIFDSAFFTGDDAVAGSGCTDIVVSNCVLNSACSPFRIGGRDVLITDCRATGPAKHPHRWTLTDAEKRGGASTDEVTGRRTVGAFFQGYTGDVAHKDFRPGNIVVRNTTVENAERFMLSVSGLPGALWQDGIGISDILFENVRATGLGMPSAVVAKESRPLSITLRNCTFAFRTPQDCAFFGKNVTVVGEDVRLENVRRLYDERDGVSYDDVPEFPSWRLEEDWQREKWGLPPLKKSKVQVPSPKVVEEEVGNREDVRELVVATDGLSPFAALSRIRAEKSAGATCAWNVRVKSGRYTFTEPLVFTPEDSGTPESPVRWIGEKDAVFGGGAEIMRWQDEGGGVWSADLPRRADGKPAFFEQLWVNGRRASRARLPDTGYFDAFSPSCEPADNPYGHVERLSLRPEDGAALAKLPPDELADAQMCVIDRWSFARRILRGYDAGKNEVTTWAPIAWLSWFRWTEKKKTIVCFENVRTAFDAPGEWFYDAKRAKVSYRPLPGEKMSETVAVYPREGLSNILVFKGEPAKRRYVHDIAFSGLVFEGTASASTLNDVVRRGNPDFVPPSEGPTETWQLQAAQGVDAAVQAEGAHRIAWRNCTVRHTANYGLRLNDGCVSNEIVNCTFEDLGAGGIWIGARKSVPPPEGYGPLARRNYGTIGPTSTAYNLVSNSVIRAGGRFNPEGIGVTIGHASDCRVVHCDIYDFYYTGVSVGWVWGFAGSVAQRNEIGYNRIYDFGKGVMSDLGGVYTLGLSDGTRIHHNLVHDVRSRTYGGWGLYADEGTENLLMEFNVVWNTTDGGFHQHFGAGNVVRNNIFAWNRELGTVRGDQRVCHDIYCSVNFLNNICLVKGGALAGKGVCNMPGAWANNVWWSESGEQDLDGMDWEGWRASGREWNGRFADPRFVDAPHYDFRLKPDSPALSVGFLPWDYAEAGVR